jgi:membrane fusion protein, multidrug efflux system
MDKKSGLRLLAALIAVSLLAACGGSRPAATVTPRAVTGVELSTVRLQASPQTIQAVGTVESVDTSILSAQIAGTVREVRVNAGDRVTRGETLAVLDDRAPKAQLNMARAGVEEASQGLVEMDHALQAARANLDFAHATFQRYQALLAKNSISRQEFDDAQTHYKAALANELALEAKKKQVEARDQQAHSQQAAAQTIFSHSRILSPLNGVVVAKQVDAGTVVMPGTPLLTVEDNAHYRLDVSVPEDFVRNIALRQLLPVSLPEGNFTARVAEIVPVADRASRTFTVKLDLPANCRCRSGEYGEASIRSGVVKTLLVPSGTVVQRGELEGVFVANDRGIVHFRLVKTGRVIGDSTEILSGLSSGERVAISKVDQLQDGVQVEEP